MSYTKRKFFNLTDHWQNITQSSNFSDIASKDITVFANYTNNARICVGGSTEPDDDSGSLLLSGKSLSGNSEYWWVKGQGTLSIVVNEDTNVVSLEELSLSSNTVPENSSEGTIIGTIQNKSVDSVLSLVDNYNNRFSISGTNLVTGATNLDFEQASSYSLTVRETLAGSPNSPNDNAFSIIVTNVLEQPVLQSIGISSNTIPENTNPGELVGSLLNKTNGSILSLVGNADGRFTLSGLNILTGLVPLNYESNQTHDIVIREILEDSPNSPRDTTLTIAVTNVSEQPNLNNLYLSEETIESGVQYTINILGTTPGSTLTGIVPDGMTLNSADRTITGTPTVAGVYNFVLTETLADSSNSGRTTNVSVTVTPASSGSVDYTIYSDADWASIPSNLTTNGGRIGINRGITLTQKTVSMTPTNTLEFVAVGTGANPRIANFIIDGAQRLTFSDIDFIAPEWMLKPPPAVLWKGSFGNIVMNRCGRIGNYRGNLGVIDPTGRDRYPEYACIIPVFDDTGAVTRYEVTRPYVGDLLADGTYNMVFNSGSVVNWTTLPTATFTVSGGNIVDTTPITPGASNATTATNISIGALSARITWTNQRRMGEWMAYGDTSSNPTQNGPVDLNDCSWTCLSNGYKSGLTPGQKLTINGWRADLCYQDSISVGLGSGNNPNDLTVAWGFATRPFALQGDAGDPHGDAVQTFTGKASCLFNPKVQIYGNVAVLGNTRGSYSNLFFVADPPTDASLGYYAEIVGNIGMASGGISSITVEAAVDTVIWGNSVGREVPSGGITSTPLIRSGYSRTLGNSLVGNNITEGIGNGSGPGSIETSRYPNLLLGYRGATVAYDDVFNTPATTDRDTLAKILTAYLPETAYAGRGHTQSGLVDYVNRTIDWTKVPTFVKFTAQVDQALGSVTASPWARIVGGPTAVTVSVSNGEYRIADDATGTNATPWTSAAGNTQKGKFIQVRVTNSASGATSTTGVVTLNDHSHNFSSTTLSTAVYPSVQFSGDDSWRRSVGAMGTTDSPTGTLFIPRFRMVAPTAIRNIFGSSSGSSAILLQVLSSGILRGTLRSPTGIVVVFNSSVPVANDVEHDIKIDWDITQASAAEGLSIYIDNVSAMGSVTTWVAGSSLSWSVTPTGGSAYGLSPVSGAFATMQLGGFYLNIAERAGVTSALVRSRFYPDTIGANAENPTGTAPRLWLNGNAAKWNNAAGLNDGTGNKYAGGAGSTGGSGTLTDVV